MHAKHFEGTKGHAKKTEKKVLVAAAAEWARESERQKWHGMSFQFLLHTHTHIIVAIIAACHFLVLLAN
jgi:hypothetical protein